MIVLQTDHISEKQLAEIALAIQNRWGIPAFVKMHEIVVMDDDAEDSIQRELLMDFETGISTIFDGLELTNVFKFRKVGKSKYSIERMPGSALPQWMNDIEAPSRVPDGVYECPHCGKWFRTDIELSLHTKLHYII